MNEELQELMESCSAQIVQKLTLGMRSDSKDNEPQLSECIEVETTDDPSLQQVRTSGWNSVELEGLDGLEVQRFAPTLNCAYQLTFKLRLRTVDLKEGLPGAVQRCLDFGKSIRPAERTTALRLISKSEVASFSYDEASLKTEAETMGFQCRLIHTNPDDNSAKNAKQQGFITNIVGTRCTLPDEVIALLVKTGGGPVFRRVVDDLTPTWRRDDPNDGIELLVIERFFLEIPLSSVVKFTK